eukprot:TRINITY_DN7141_c0_g1_i4.p1 TRINITY_DN7141_c0_g1~~TRINITY_DN7141_c0_g1_i4.p1  ORF type:complete len:141 (+),score=18.43 TRINITY_DN7141_c0_g1_i4:135-557(+)
MARAPLYYQIKCQIYESCLLTIIRSSLLSNLPHSVTYLGASYWNDHLYIITEFMPRGSLYRLIHDTKTELSYQLRLQMAYDAARGMRHLHNLKPIVVHRDLKSPNLLVRCRSMDCFRPPLNIHGEQSNSYFERRDNTQII